VKRLILVAAATLTVVIFASGYLISFVTTILAMWLDLPGPYADDPVAWLWFALSIAILFAISFAFCRWLVGRVERRFKDAATFQ